MHDEPTLAVRDEGGIRQMTLARPHRLNALDFTMIDAMCASFEALRYLPEIRVVVLRGVGRAFCAGLDLDEAATERPLGRALDAQRRLSRLIVAMRRCPQPIVALIQGPASGAGFALALAADLRLVADDARLNAAFIRIGLSGCDAGVSYFLPRLVGYAVASEILLTGRFIDAATAEQLGLAKRVGASERLVPEGQALCDELLRAAPLGLSLTKEALGYAVDAPGLEAALALEDRNQLICMQDPDFREALSAFRERRAPRFGMTHVGGTSDAD